MVDACGGTGVDTAEGELRARVREMALRMAPEPREAGEGSLDLFADLGYHSLALLELAFALEEAFGLPPIDEPLARALRTTGDLEEHVVRVVAESGRD